MAELSSDQISRKVSDAQVWPSVGFTGISAFQRTSSWHHTTTTWAYGTHRTKYRIGSELLSDVREPKNRNSKIFVPQSTYNVTLRLKSIRADVLSVKKCLISNDRSSYVRFFFEVVSPPWPRVWYVQLETGKRRSMCVPSIIERRDKFSYFLGNLPPNLDYCLFGKCCFGFRCWDSSFCGIKMCGMVLGQTLGFSYSDWMSLHCCRQLANFICGEHFLNLGEHFYFELRGEIFLFLCNAR